MSHFDPLEYDHGWLNGIGILDPAKLTKDHLISIRFFNTFIIALVEKTGQAILHPDIPSLQDIEGGSRTWDSILLEENVANYSYMRLEVSYIIDLYVKAFEYNTSDYGFIKSDYWDLVGEDFWDDVKNDNQIDNTYLRSLMTEDAATIIFDTSQVERSWADLKRADVWAGIGEMFNAMRYYATPVYGPQSDPTLPRVGYLATQKDFEATGGTNDGAGNQFNSFDDLVDDGNDYFDRSQSDTLQRGLDRMGEPNQYIDKSNGYRIYKEEVRQTNQKNYDIDGGDPRHRSNTFRASVDKEHTGGIEQYCRNIKSDHITADNKVPLIVHSNFTEGRTLSEIDGSVVHLPAAIWNNQIPFVDGSDDPETRGVAIVCVYTGSFDTLTGLTSTVVTTAGMTQNNTSITTPTPTPDPPTDTDATSGRTYEERDDRLSIEYAAQSGRLSRGDDTIIFQHLNTTEDGDNAGTLYYVEPEEETP